VRSEELGEISTNASVSFDTGGTAGAMSVFFGNISNLIYNDHNAIPLLQEIIEYVSYRIIMSTIENAKTVPEISLENRLPLSSTYKKIRKLQKMGLISISKVTLDGNGKKIVSYRSRIKSFRFYLERDKIMLQFEKNDFANIF
jgi:hypothetical protein